MARATSTVVLSTVTIGRPLPSVKRSIGEIYASPAQPRTRAGFFILVRPRRPRSAECRSSRAQRQPTMDEEAEKAVIAAARRWYAEDLRLRAPIRRRVATVDAFGAVPRE